jgi:polyisoprenoid-binding protein YceI
MTKTLSTIILIIIIAFGVVWFMSREAKNEINTDSDNSPVNEDMVASQPADGRYRLNNEAANISWRGSKTLIAGYEDTGTIDIESGHLIVENGIVTEGNIIFDMTSIKASATSNKVAGVGDLTTHLRSQDFFDVNLYPKATFSLTLVEPVGGSNGGTFIFIGDLVLKDIAKEIQFPVTFGENIVGQNIVRGEFEIDRTDWGIHYGSGQFFQNLGDRVIADEVGIIFEVIIEKI